MAPRGALAHLPRPSRRGAHQALLAARQAGRARLLASLPYRVADLYCSCSRHLVITPTKQAGLLTLQIPTTYYLLLLLTTCYYCLLQAGLLMLQIPTGRRPRPFSPSVLVPLPEPLRGRAIAYLREDLGFVCESGLDARAGWEAGSARWMHELGVAFARLDPKGRTCLAPAACNPLQLIAAPHSPSQPLTAPHSPSQPLAAPHSPRSALRPSLPLRPRIPVERQPAAAEHGSTQLLAAPARPLPRLLRCARGDARRPQLTCRNARDGTRARRRAAAPACRAARCPRRQRAGRVRRGGLAATRPRADCCGQVGRGRARRGL